jgi:hypothetical protein
LLQLYLDGAEQPMRVSGESDGSFDRTDAIEFYATGEDTPYTNAQVYWLVAGAQPGKRVAIMNAQAQPGGARSFAYTIERQDRTLYFASLLNGDAENFFGAVVTAQPVAETLTLSHLDSAAAAGAELEVALQGVTDLPGSTESKQASLSSTERRTTSRSCPLRRACCWRATTSSPLSPQRASPMSAWSITFA